MRWVTGIDPGPAESAMAELVTPPGMAVRLHSAVKLPTAEMLRRLRTQRGTWAIEDVRGYGAMSFPQTLIDTCKCVGKVELIAETMSETPLVLLTRAEVRSLLGVQARGGDREVREAVLDCFGLLHLADPKKRKQLPEPFNAVTGDSWSAIAIALAAARKLGIR